MSKIIQYIKKINHKGLSRFIRLFKSDELTMSLQSMREHKTRTFLTMLGIIFGVGSVISMLAIGEGARRKSLQQISNLGLKNIIIKNKEGMNTDINSRFLNDGDITAISSIIKDVDYATGLSVAKQNVRAIEAVDNVEIIGTLPNYFRVFNLELKSGGFFSNIDNKYQNRVCVIGESIAKNLLKFNAYPGQEIKINDQWFKVTGVLDYQPVQSSGGNQFNFNQSIFIPLETMRLRFERDPKNPELEQVVVHIKDRERVIGNSEVIKKILYRRHQETENFEMVVPEELLNQSQETQRIFNIVMGAIAGISLLVGGIGIMNIMLASILERTREIGLRRAIGATKDDIKTQFLLESILISLGGGIVGIILGYLLTFGVTMYTEWHTAVTLWSILLSVGVSSLVGILFGYFPAKKAANLDPIEALRYE